MLCLMALSATSMPCSIKLLLGNVTHWCHTLRVETWEKSLNTWSFGVAVSSPLGSTKLPVISAVCAISEERDVPRYRHALAAMDNEV
ncbi:MAG: hypothetical protein JWO15_2671 [Sphingomonadales bacterium]|nr:hypothetical protein [Sphingomonadales bacterium]